MKNKSLIITGVIVAVVLIWFISSYNGFVAKEEQVNKSWSQVENVYQRRMDLIPNLVATVKGYANQEEKIFTKVAELRSRVGQINLPKDVTSDPAQLAKYQQAQKEMGSAISRLLVVAENYPDLKSNQNFLALQSQLEGTENRISVERKRFIDSVQEYNSSVRRFPAKIVAAVGGFSNIDYYEADKGADKAPDVSFE
jgi:LemA protein